MSTQVTVNATSYTGSLNGYSTTRTSRNVGHAVMGTNSKAWALRAAGLRTGSLSIVFADYATVAALHSALASGLSGTLADTTYSGINMAFIPSGDITLEQPDERSAWVVSFDFEEFS